jgi:hypothetical protein
MISKTRLIVFANQPDGCLFVSMGPTKKSMTRSTRSPALGQQASIDAYLSSEKAWAAVSRFRQALFAPIHTLLNTPSLFLSRIAISTD